jgi:hypothetical protein
VEQPTFKYNECILCMMHSRISRVMKVEVARTLEGDSQPSKVFHEISKEYGRKLDVKEIKKELEERF